MKQRESRSRSEATKCARMTPTELRKLARLGLSEN